MTEAGDEVRRPAGSDLPVADLRRLVERGTFGYIATTDAGLIERVNSTVLSWLHVDRDELLGCKFQDLLAPGDRIYFDTHVRPLLHMGGAARDIAVELVGSGADRFPVLMSAELVRLGERPAFVDIVMVDARSRRSYEQELLRERQSAERAQHRLQLLYDLVSGFAEARSVEEVEHVVTSATSSPFEGARCHMWLFSNDLRRISHVHVPGSEVERDDVVVEDRRLGAAIDELAAGDLVVVADRDAVAHRYPMIVETLHGADLRSAVLAPLLDDGRLVGTLSFGFPDEHEFDEDERLAVRSLGIQTSHALRRARLHEAQTRSRLRLESLYDFGRSLSSAVTVDEVIDRITRTGYEVFNADHVRIGRLHRDRTLVVSGGRTAATTMSVRRPIDAPDIASTAAREGAFVSATSADELESRFEGSAEIFGNRVEHAMAVSLGDGERVVGVWALGYDRPGPMADDDDTLLMLFADEASQAIRRAIAHEREANVRRRAVLRQSISEALNRAATTAAVADALVVEGRNAFDADGLAVLVVDDGELKLAGQSGLPTSDSTAHPSASTSSADVRRLLDSPGPIFAEGAEAVTRELGDLSFGRWEAGAVLPLSIGGRAIGLVIVLFANRATLDLIARRALAGIAAEVSVAVSRAQMFEVEHAIAVTLQRSLLSVEVPEIDGWRIDPWYSPSNQFMMVGGDLYDVTLLDDGGIVIVIGDVVGHGLDAASSLGQLRSAARAVSLDRTRPAELLDRLDAFARSSREVRGATVCCVIIEPDGRGRYVCAGHPYPILVTGGQATLLTGGRSALLGYAATPRVDADFTLGEDSSLVLYTDGVVERRSESIDDGIERLRRLSETIDFGGDDQPARTIGTSMLPDDHRDDAVVVTVTRTRSA